MFQSISSKPAPAGFALLSVVSTIMLEVEKSGCSVEKNIFIHVQWNDLTACFKLLIACSKLPQRATFDRACLLR